MKQWCVVTGHDLLNQKGLHHLRRMQICKYYFIDVMYAWPWFFTVYSGYSHRINFRRGYFSVGHFISSSTEMPSAEMSSTEISSAEMSSAEMSSTEISPMKCPPLKYLQLKWPPLKCPPLKYPQLNTLQWNWDIFMPFYSRYCAPGIYILIQAL